MSVPRGCRLASMHCGVDCGPGAVVVIHDCALFERSAQRGRTALQHAESKGHPEVVEALK